MISACEIMVVAALRSDTCCGCMSIYLVYCRRAPGNGRSRSPGLGGLNENLLARQVQAAPREFTVQPSCQWVTWLFYAATLSGI